MPDTFRALRAHKTEAGIETRLETLTDADLMEADVTVRVEASTLTSRMAWPSPAGRPSSEPFP
ncbi:MAG: hypothetical protein ACKOD3_08055 [Phenylobacterium sp.]